jgi:diguanylate cyclase (GGDEF)-like protein
MVAAAAAFRVVVGDAAAADVLRFVVAAGVACAAYGTVDIALFVVYIRLAVGLRARATGLVAVTEKASQLSFGALFAGLWHGSPVLVVLLAPIAVMLQREVFFRSVERASRTDVKTGLLNARAFRAEAERDLRRAARTSQPAALLMLDLDHLREVNNRHGHLAGDVAIARVAQVLREEVRDYDLAARFGGEEFAVLLPGTTAEQAVVIAERIRRAIAATALDVGDSAITIGVSVGVADSAVNGPALDDVIAAADQALYAAKAAGRNTVRAVHRLDGIALSNAGGAAPETG